MAKGNVPISSDAVGGPVSQARAASAAATSKLERECAYEAELVAGAFEGYDNFVEVISTGLGTATVRLGVPDSDYTVLGRINTIDVTFEVVDPDAEDLHDA